MERRWNLLPLGGFAVTLLAFLSYFVFFARFPATRDVPWVNLLLFAGGLVLLVLGLRRAFGHADRYRGKIVSVLLSALSVLVLALFLFYNFWFSSQLPVAKAAPRVGEKAPDFTLPDQNGQPVRLANLLASPSPTGSGAAGSWVLLVFYRGYW